MHLNKPSIIINKPKRTRLHSFFINSKLYLKIIKQDTSLIKQNEIKESLVELHSINNTMISALRFIQQHQRSIDNGPQQAGEKRSDAVLLDLRTSHQLTDEFIKKYSGHVNEINSINEFRESVQSTNKELRLHIEKESFDKSTDLRHKLTLTALRVCQIPIFIFATYISIYGVVKLLGEKDLVIPRGLISIVPSGLEQNAQKMAKSQEKSDNNSSEISATP